MWLFTRHGFFSVVAAKQTEGGRVGRGPIDPETLMVRARVRRHLDNLRSRFAVVADAKILETRDSDYRYRMLVPKSAWTQLAAALAAEVDYGNFKGVCAKSEGVDDAYVHALHEVWSVHNRLQA